MSDYKLLTCTCCGKRQRVELGTKWKHLHGFTAEVVALHYDQVKMRVGGKNQPYFSVPVRCFLGEYKKA